MRHGVRWPVFVGSFRLRHSFVIRHWPFVIDFYQSLASEHATAVGELLKQAKEFINARGWQDLNSAVTRSVSLFPGSRIGGGILRFSLEAGTHLALFELTEIQGLPPLIADADIPHRACGSAAIRVMIFQL